MAIRKRPEAAGWHTNLGAVYGEKGLYKEAIEQFRMAIEKDPRSAEAH